MVSRIKRNTWRTDWLKLWVYWYLTQGILQKAFRSSACFKIPHVNILVNISNALINQSRNHILCSRVPLASVQSTWEYTHIQQLWWLSFSMMCLQVNSGYRREDFFNTKHITKGGGGEKGTNVQEKVCHARYWAVSPPLSALLILLIWHMFHITYEAAGLPLLPTRW